MTKVKRKINESEKTTINNFHYSNPQIDKYQGKYFQGIYVPKLDPKTGNPIWPTELWGEID